VPTNRLFKTENRGRRGKNPEGKKEKRACRMGSARGGREWGGWRGWLSGNGSLRSPHQYGSKREEVRGKDTRRQISTTHVSWERKFHTRWSLSLQKHFFTSRYREENISSEAISTQSLLGDSGEDSIKQRFQYLVTRVGLVKPSIPKSPIQGRLAFEESLRVTFCPTLQTYWADGGKERGGGEADEKSYEVIITSQSFVRKGI